MAEHQMPLARLFAQDDLPVRIPDWPEGIGLAVCRAEGRILGFVPWHKSERPQNLRSRLVAATGPAMQGFATWPALKGIPEARLAPGEDSRLRAELELAMRAMPRLLEEANDFAINFEFAQEEGLTLDALSDGVRRKEELAAQVAQKAMTDQLPVGYQPFVKADRNCELIAGAVLRPAGAAGIDLVLQPGGFSREIPSEVQVLVREDSLRVAIPLAPVLVAGKLPPVLRLPAGALLMGNSGGKPVPATVLRRSGMLFVAPDYAAVANQTPSLGVPEKKSTRAFPWIWVAAGLAALTLSGAIAGGVWWMLQPAPQKAPPPAAVDDLRSNLFAPSVE